MSLTLAALRSRAACLLVLLALPAFAAGPPHLELDLSLDPERRSLDVQAQVDIEAGAHYVWELASELKPGEARLDGRVVEYARLGARDGISRYQVALPDRGAHRLSLRYAGTLAQLDMRLDHRGVLQHLPAMAGAQGSFLPAGARWYPSPGALFSYALTVRTPAGQRAVAPGRLVTESLRSEGNTARFEFPQPAEGIDLMAGPYQVTERKVELPGGQPLRLRTWFHAPLAASAEDYLAASERFVRRYSAEIGAYPYGEFSIVSSPLPTGFGMPTLTYLGIEVLKLPFIRDTSLGHEILHNWWGNGVYPDTSRGNWSEGLTTFMADYAYREDKPAEPGAREMRHGWLRDYAALAPGTERPLAEFRSRTHTASSAIGYGKSAMLFFMLREELGRAVFAAGIRDFWREQRFRHAGFDDLRASFERASGRKLGAFFEQWVDRGGAPALRVLEANASQTGAETRLELSLEQGEPAYDLRLPLRALGPAGSQDLTLRLSRPRQEFALQLPFAPEALQLDPEFTLWRRLAEGEAPPIMREIETAQAPLAVVLGADAALRAAAATLLEKFSDGSPRIGAPGELARHRGAAIVIGEARELDALIAEQRLPARPAEAQQPGTLHVWAARAEGSRSLLFVSLSGERAAQAEQLAMLARRLPHLSAYSWLRFEGTKLAARGIWPAQAQRVPLPRAP